MIKRQSIEWDRFLLASLEQLLNQPPLRFSQMTPGILPRAAGIYLITKMGGDVEIPYYIGRTKNIGERLYRHHLMGSLASARLKKYLIDNQVCSTIEEADYRKRGAIESYCTSILFPEYGIEEEH